MNILLISGLANIPGLIEQLLFFSFFMVGISHYEFSAFESIQNYQYMEIATSLKCIILIIMSNDNYVF